MKSFFSITSSITFITISLLFSSCGDETKEPIADFKFESDGETVYFVNFSENGDTYEWDFGDGTTSNMQNPIHVFTEAKDFTVTLKVTGTGGEASSSQTVTIKISDVVAGKNGRTWKIDETKPTVATDLTDDSSDTYPGGFLSFIGLGDEYDDTFTFTADGSLSINTSNGQAFASIVSVLMFKQWDLNAFMEAVGNGKVTLPHNPGETDPTTDLGMCAFDYGPDPGKWEVKKGDVEIVLDREGTTKKFKDVSYFELSGGMYVGMFDVENRIIIESVKSDEMVLKVFMHTNPFGTDYSLTFTFKRVEEK